MVVVVAAVVVVAVVVAVGAAIVVPVADVVNQHFSAQKAGRKTKISTNESVRG